MVLNKLYTAYCSMRDCRIGMGGSLGNKTWVVGNASWAVGNTSWVVGKTSFVGAMRRISCMK